MEWLRPEPGRTIVDGTLGGGGHARLLAEAVDPRGMVIALDRDSAPSSERRRTERIAGAGWCMRITVTCRNYWQN